MSDANERGFTLVEVLIAITLVATLSVGMLMAMRTGMITLERIDARLQSNRRVMSIEQILGRQIGGVMPVLGDCYGAAPGRVAAFMGTEQMLHLASTYSLAEGSRGSPHSLQFDVVPSPGGGVRLVVTEQPYTSPASFCPGQNPSAPPMSPQAFVLADHLASCRFSYRAMVPNTPMSGSWLPVWNRLQELPAAIRVEMMPLTPDPASLRLTSVTVPIHVTGIVGYAYADTQQ
jgi:prepilin-type N-terminal cleavage/methylation domain-containing protein